MFITIRSFRHCWMLGFSAIVFAQSGETPTIPKGTQVTVRTLDSIQSKQSEVGQSYRCTMDSPVVAEGKEIVSKGADCVMKIVEMKSAGKLKGSNELKLVVSEIRVGSNLIAVNSEPTEVKGKGKGKSTGLRTGIGAAAGAGLGAVLGGGKGAAIGGGIGAGAGAASAAMTSGPEIKVPPETLLTFVIQ
ncbi:hypothetical protein [Paludibaculum fermentans]|uniref:hypothetical protein n=1 Tax=Paludibaculum fermentans TaxID=1473598 RepID=UPI003EB6D0A4